MMGKICIRAQIRPWAISLKILKCWRWAHKKSKEQLHNWSLEVSRRQIWLYKTWFTLQDRELHGSSVLCLINQRCLKSTNTMQECKSTSKGSANCIIMRMRHPFVTSGHQSYLSSTMKCLVRDNVVARSTRTDCFISSSSMSACVLTQSKADTGRAQRVL